jgi:hypothetical protein
MGNEEFLIISYFGAGLLCAGFGLAAWLWLRVPTRKIVSELDRKSLANILQKSLPATMILIALSGFLSVSYSGCSNRAYKDIVSDRSYILSVNGQQISETLSSISFGVFLWALIIFIILLAVRRQQAK